MKSLHVVIISIVLLMGVMLNVSMLFPPKTDSSQLQVLMMNENPYDMECLEVADLWDEYIHMKHPLIGDSLYARGTKMYAKYILKSSEEDESLMTIPEYQPMRIYALAYNVHDCFGKYNPRDTVGEYGMMKGMYKRTIREYVWYNSGCSPEEYLDTFLNVCGMSLVNDNEEPDTNRHPYTTYQNNTYDGIIPLR